MSNTSNMLPLIHFHNSGIRRPMKLLIVGVGFAGCAIINDFLSRKVIYHDTSTYLYREPTQLKHYEHMDIKNGVHTLAVDFSENNFDKFMAERKINLGTDPDLWGQEMLTLTACTEFDFIITLTDFEDPLAVKATTWFAKHSAKSTFNILSVIVAPKRIYNLDIDNFIKYMKEEANGIVLIQKQDDDYSKHQDYEEFFITTQAYWHMFNALLSLLKISLGFVCSEFISIIGLLIEGNPFYVGHSTTKEPENIDKAVSKALMSPYLHGKSITHARVIFFTVKSSHAIEDVLSVSDMVSKDAPDFLSIYSAISSMKNTDEVSVTILTCIEGEIN